MRTILLLGGLAVAGCASSVKIEMTGNEHLLKAESYEAHGYHQTAMKEHAAAEKQFAKADERRYSELLFERRVW